MVKDSEFSISVVGDVSGETFKGDFRATKFLSHKQQLVLDRKRRELLGENSKDATARANNQAEIFSQLAVRLTKAPAWWVESDNGMELVDDNVAVEVYNAALKVEVDAITAVKKTAEENRTELKQAVEESNK